MPNTWQTQMYLDTTHPRREDQMTSYELFASERTTAIQNSAAERARRVARLADATGSPRASTEPRRLRARLRLVVSRSA